LIAGKSTVKAIFLQVGGLHYLTNMIVNVYDRFDTRSRVIYHFC
jgi:hypothetical protein